MQIKRLLLLLVVVVISASSFGQITITRPYNPDINSNEVIDIEDLLSLLSIYSDGFEQQTILVNGQDLESYIMELQEAAANATGDSVAIPALIPGTLVGQILYWNGDSWQLLNPGETGHVLHMGSDQVPVWQPEVPDLDCIVGCADPDACNFSADVTLSYPDFCDYLTCLGCTDSLYLEFSDMATEDDGSCLTLIVPGCTNPFYMEYDADATQDDGSCTTLLIPGCMDPLFMEYDAEANADDGSCTNLIVSGCTDPLFLEYDEAANQDDGSCVTLVIPGCMDPLFVEYNAEANADDGTCANLIVLGCTDPLYLEYNSAANLDDGSCSVLVIYGCTDSLYVEFNPLANTDDGSCSELVQVGCTDPAAANYDPSAMVDDGSCVFAADCTPVAFDGYTYDVVQIGLQCWFAENLRSEIYTNGDAIPGNLSNSEWTASTSGTQALYNNDLANLENYGRLYNWYAVNDDRGLCPTGWHVPTEGEWSDLIAFLGGSDLAASALKSSPSDAPSWNGSNSSGFSAVPGGYRHSYGYFTGQGSTGYWWSATPNAFITTYANQLNLSSYSDYVSPNSSSDMRRGCSIRCIRE